MPHPAPPDDCGESKITVLIHSTTELQYPPEPATVPLHKPCCQVSHLFVPLRRQKVPVAANAASVLVVRVVSVRVRAVVRCHLARGPREAR